MAKRFSRVETTRLPLSDGDWIEIKRELTLGEILAVRRKSTTPEGTVDDSTMLLAKFEAYLTDWSFRDDDDKPVAVSAATIASLNETTAAEIMTAIRAHEEAEGEAGNAGGETAPTAA